MVADEELIGSLVLFGFLSYRLISSVMIWVSVLRLSFLYVVGFSLLINLHISIISLRRYTGLFLPLLRRCFLCRRNYLLIVYTNVVNVTYSLSNTHSL